VIRPSSKGTDHLTITWKVYEDIYFHIDIQEIDKPNEQAIGATLVIQNSGLQNNRFEDLDEIIARFVDPMVQYSKNVIAFQAFRFGDEKEIDDLLQIEKSQNRTKVPYFLSFAKTPGIFIFSYLLNTIHREPFSVTPEGYLHKSSSKIMKSPQQLIGFFKHYIVKKRDSRKRSHPSHNTTSSYPSSQQSVQSSHPRDGKGRQHRPSGSGTTSGGDHSHRRQVRSHRTSGASKSRHV